MRAQRWVTTQVWSSTHVYRETMVAWRETLYMYLFLMIATMPV